MSGAAKLCLFLGGILALAALAWMAFLPAIVERELRIVTGFGCSVSVLTADPFTGRVAVRGLVVRNPPRYPAPDFFELRELRADVSVFSWIFTDRIVINELDLDVAKVELVQQHDGKSNAGDFMAAFSRSAPAPAGSPAPGKRTRYLVRRLHIRLDQLVVADYMGEKKDERVYDLHIDHSYSNVSNSHDLLAPEVVNTLHSFGLHHDIAQLLPGDFGKALAAAVGGAAQVENKVMGATKKTGEFLKGALDKLEQSAKP